MSERVKTGIKKLDDMMNGGLIDGDIALVSGEPGTGKSTLATMFLVEGMDHGEPGVYISLEEKKGKFYNHMKSFGWDLEKYEKEKKLHFEVLRGEDLKKHVENGSQMFDSIIDKMKAKRVVIDSISAYAHIFPTEMERRNRIRDLFDTIERWNVTCLMTGEAEQPERDYGVDYMVDATINMRNLLNEKGKRDRYIEIVKMRGTKHMNGSQYMQLTDRGVEIKGSG